MQMNSYIISYLGSVVSILHALPVSVCLQLICIQIIQRSYLISYNRPAGWLERAGTKSFQRLPKKLQTAPSARGMKEKLKEGVWGARWRYFLSLPLPAAAWINYGCLLLSYFFNAFGLLAEDKIDLKSWVFWSQDGKYHIVFLSVGRIPLFYVFFYFFLIKVQRSVFLILL